MSVELSADQPLAALAPPLPGAPVDVLPPRPFRATFLGRCLVRLLRFSASLKLAISLLTLFTLCLVVATLLESAYSARIAQDLVYGTWWFTLLLVLLAVNILGAALKKFPWKRHQLGFLITHTGLLVLVFGGLLTTLGGVEGQMLLIDSEQRDLQREVRMSNQSDTIQLVNQHQLEVVRVPPASHEDEPLLRDVLQFAQDGVELDDRLRSRLDGHFWTTTFAPGALPWRADQHLEPRLPWMLRVLQTLATPSPGFTTPLAGPGALHVENYYPHSERWPFAPANVRDEGFPAVQLSLMMPAMGPRPLKRWVTSLPRFETDPAPVAFEMFVLPEPALLNEFVDPPAQVGPAGQLVLALGPRRVLRRINLDDVKPDQPIELPGTPLTFTLKERGHIMDLLSHKTEIKTEGPSFPAVRFELTQGDERGSYVACARLPHLPALQQGVDVANVTAWYHVADFRWGETHRMGCLQFLSGPDQTLYYRVYGKEGLRAKGQKLDSHDATPHTLPWKPMDVQFQVLHWLPRAAQRDHIVPCNVEPGAEPSEKYEPALRCVLENKDDHKEFLVRMGRVAQKVTVGREIYFVRYRMASERLDFRLQLSRAEQTTDPGTTRAASYASDVVLHRDTERSEHRIAMNEPLREGSFKVYQTRFQPLLEPQTFTPVLDNTGRRVNMSGLTVARDPGLVFKYVGSLLLVLGIATMFWMRAYFFRPVAAAQA